MHLSIRGHLEYNLIKDMLTPETADDEFMERVNRNLEAIAGWWMDAEKKLIIPEPAVALPSGEAREASVKNGYRLFKDSSQAGCIGCHKDYGRQSDLFFDAWGTIGRPADLTNGLYRGGRNWAGRRFGADEPRNSEKLL
jgi:mono/diheme cytochrome c family protein